MYAIESYLGELKSDVCNKGHLEGSMVEGFRAKECVRFVAQYLSRTNAPTQCFQASCITILSSKHWLSYKGKGKNAKKKRPATIMDQLTWAQAHQYVLFTYDYEEVEKYIK
ncbi:Vacuolar protein sorting-associated protein 33B [Bienertia sinuspersici]